MIIATCLRRIKTCKRLGFAQSLHLFKERQKTFAFRRLWHQKYAGGVQSHTWEDVSLQQGCTPSFERFFSQQRARELPCLEQLFTAALRNDDCIHSADEWVRKEFSLLGSKKRSFKDIPWHEDIRLSGQDLRADTLFNATAWYDTIQLEIANTQQLGKDIKVPWELSRLQHVVLLARAYALTYDEQYSTSCKEYIESWVQANPFLHGINWACPMEVALRSISLVIAFTYLRRSPVLDDEFWRMYVTSLYDHLVYLENNWELYDLRTSNHYVSNLVGYLYLCWFFNDCSQIGKRLLWCHQELLHELEKQINTDGTSYEQSTQYHRFVTELFYHHMLISEQLRLPLPKKVQEKMAAMYDYLIWCTPKRGELLSIGDNDSSKVTVAGLPESIIHQYASVSQYCSRVRHFDQAGLSIIKTASWHLSLRHAVYNEQEPTCHFHNDATSITLAYSGVPFIVDPGSYVYTASAYWRNLFRSVQAHSGLYLASAQTNENSNFTAIEPVTISDEIFLLPRNPAIIPAQDSSTALCMRTTHADYAQYGYAPERRVMLSEKQDIITLTDQWHLLTRESDPKRASQALFACFQFVLHPDVTITKVSKDPSSWLLQSHGITLQLSSDQLFYELRPGWYSPTYGIKMATQMIFAQQELVASSVDRQLRTTITVRSDTMSQ